MNTHVSESASQRQQILVVDDTPENLQLLVKLLTREGYQVRPAPDGEFALNFAHAHPPDLILLDIKLPGMQGYEVCQQLKADEATCEIPVIFLSALNEVVDKVRGFDAGGVDYITKPFQAEEVLARVKTHLELKRLQKNLQQEIVRRTQAEEELREANSHLETANQQLHFTNQQLEVANASKNTFFSIIAHDLRAPFTGLIGMLSSIIKNLENGTYDQESLQEVFQVMYTSSKKTYALLENLLAWARLQQGSMKFCPEHIVLDVVTKLSVEVLIARAEQKQIELNNRIPDNTYVYADTNMVKTIMRNLLSNALKFTDHGGKIEIYIRSQHDREFEIAVSDTGVGMAQNALEKIFRIDQKYVCRGTDGEEGTGLGLLLCKELVEKHGGQILAESEPGKGTTFAFTLPRTPEKK